MSLSLPELVLRKAQARSSFMSRLVANLVPKLEACALPLVSSTSGSRKPWATNRAASSASMKCMRHHARVKDRGSPLPSDQRGCNRGRCHRGSPCVRRQRLQPSLLDRCHHDLPLASLSCHRVDASGAPSTCWSRLILLPPSEPLLLGVHQLATDGD